MNVNVNRGESYVPAVNGNDKADRPVTFRLHFLTVEDQCEMEYFEYVGVGGGKSPRVRVKVNNADVFRRGVERIENLTVDGKPVESAEEFLAIRGLPKWVSEMVADVAVHLKNAMEAPEKN